MSKEAALRAMREAAYRERTAGSTVAPRAARPAPRPAGTKAVAAAAPPATDALCGHRSMNGRTCTREQGHAAKSHRYG
jgi:hypothetical protein